MIDHYFYCTYYAYLLGNLQDAMMYYEWLREEFNATKDPTALKPYQLSELKKIKIAIDTGILPGKAWVDEPHAVLDNNTPDIKQKELTKYIATHGTDQLREIVGGASDFHLYNVEHPCAAYGRVDMVYRDMDTIYPVEVKRTEGRHDLIGQTLKYDLFFKLNLHLGVYERVCPVTLCHTYDPHTLSELKRNSVETVKYSFCNNRLKLSRV